MCRPATISPTVGGSVETGRDLLLLGAILGMFKFGLLVVASLPELDFGDWRSDNLDNRDPSNRLRVGAASKSNGLMEAF